MSTGIPQRFFWSWDHSTNWTLHAFGTQNCGVSNAYAKHRMSLYRTTAG